MSNTIQSTIVTKSGKDVIFKLGKDETFKKLYPALLFQKEKRKKETDTNNIEFNDDN